MMPIKNGPTTKTEEIELNDFKTKDADPNEGDSEDNDLDYYLGARKEQKYCRDRFGLEQMKEDYLIYHCGVSEEDYNNKYRKNEPEVYHKVERKFKQIPFKIRKKKKNEDKTWMDKAGFFKIFAHRRDSEYSASDTYTDCDSEEEVSNRNNALSDCEDGAMGNVIEDLNEIKADENSDSSGIKGVRIKEVSDGRPCENCPELCPGFIGHAWRWIKKHSKCHCLTHITTTENRVPTGQKNTKVSN